MQITKKALIPMYNPKTMSIDAVEVENTFTGKTRDEILEQISAYEIGLSFEWQDAMFSKFNINNDEETFGNLIKVGNIYDTKEIQSWKKEE